MFTCTCYNADLATFRVMFPGLVSVSDDYVQDSLNKANCVLIGTYGDTYWGDTICQATLYFAAHNIAYLSNVAASTSVDENGNVITNKTASDLSGASADGLSVSFQSMTSSATTNPMDAYLESTPYGKVFLALAQSRMPQLVSGVC